MSHAGDFHGSAAVISPNTPLGKLLKSIGNVLERASNNDREADMIESFYYKRNLAMAVDMTLLDAYDHVKVIDYSRAIESLIATCHMDRESPLIAMLLGAQAASLQTCDKAIWQATYKSVLGHCCPYAVQAADADLVASAERMTGEQLDPYYARFTVILDRAKWLRGTLTKDVSDDWLRPHLERWTMKLGNAQLAAATLVLGPGSTLQDFYWAISKAAGFLLGDLQSSARPCPRRQQINASCTTWLTRKKTALMRSTSASWRLRTTSMLALVATTAGATAMQPMIAFVAADATVAATPLANATVDDDLSDDPAPRRAE
jgi:hypothetical protein